MVEKSGGTTASPHCAHCHRAVRETVHTRTDYRVDYYSLHTGPGEPVVVEFDDGQPPLTYIKVAGVHEIVTCVDCLERPSVRAERERLFRPEREEGGYER